MFIGASVGVEVYGVMESARDENSITIKSHTKYLILPSPSPSLSPGVGAVGVVFGEEGIGAAV